VDRAKTVLHCEPLQERAREVTQMWRWKAFLPEALEWPAQVRFRKRPGKSIERPSCIWKIDDEESARDERFMTSAH